MRDSGGIIHPPEALQKRVERPAVFGPLPLDPWSCGHAAAKTSAVAIMIYKCLLCSLEENWGPVAAER
jgi:hypothetical protein